MSEYDEYDHDYDDEPGDEERPEYYVELQEDGSYITPFGDIRVSTPHDPNSCGDCNASVEPIRIRMLQEQQAGEARRENPPCRFFAPAEASGEAAPEQWPYDRLPSFAACTNPAVVGLAGIGPCQFVERRWRCAGRRDPETTEVGRPFVAQLVGR